MRTLYRLPPGPHRKPATSPGLLALLVLMCFVSPGAAPVAAQFPLPDDVNDFLQDLFRLTPQQREELRSVEVPWRTEQGYGRQLLLGYQQQLRRQRIGWSDRNRDARYLQELVQRMQPLMTHAARYRRIQVYVVDSPDIDARSIPGGHLIFWRGLLEFAESEAALIGIVGHELSHLDRRHQLKPIQQWIRAREHLARPRDRDSNEFFEFGQSMMKTFHPFHPDEEAEADRDSVDWMYQLGYDPRELARLFERLADRRAAAELPLPGFLQTHPLFPQRARAVLEQYGTLQRDNPRVDLIIGREALIRRSPDPAIAPH
jgi:hypothetical protein